MTANYIGQIVLGGWNFAPINYAFCNGQLQAISQNEALFAIIGTTYGGDGITTFALPNFQGRGIVNIGQSPGLSNYDLGEQIGTPNVTLNSAQVPQHNHLAIGYTPAAAGDYVLTPPANGWLANDSKGGRLFSGSPPTQQMAQGAIANTGGSQPHSNQSPYQVINFVIALFGIFPSRN